MPKRRDLLKAFAAAGAFGSMPQMLRPAHAAVQADLVHNLEHEDGGMMRNCSF